MILDLNTVVERYHERCRFYAWDVYEVLSRRYKSTYSLLEYVAKTDKPVSCEEIATTFGYDDANVNQRLLALVKHGLLHRHKTKGERYLVYNISEFGQMVLACDPLTREKQPQIDRHNPETLEGKSKDRRNKYDWAALDESIRYLHKTGMRQSDMATRLDVNISALKHYLYKIGLVNSYLTSGDQ